MPAGACGCPGQELAGPAQVQTAPYTSTVLSRDRGLAPASDRRLRVRPPGAMPVVRQDLKVRVDLVVPYTYAPLLGAGNVRTCRPWHGIGPVWDAGGKRRGLPGGRVSRPGCGGFAVVRP